LQLPGYVVAARVGPRVVIRVSQPLGSGILFDRLQVNAIR
jgi:hypothetical protein